MKEKLQKIKATLEDIIPLASNEVFNISLKAKHEINVKNWTRIEAAKQSAALIDEIIASLEGEELPWKVGTAIRLADHEYDGGNRKSYNKTRTDYVGEAAIEAIIGEKNGN